MVLIYGGGAVGLGIASALADAGERVRVVARPDTVDALQHDGLRRSGLFGTVVLPPERIGAAASLAALPAAAPADFVLVCTKSFDSAAAAEALAGAGPAVGNDAHIVLCQNGWGNAEHFVGRFGEARVWNARVITGFRRPSPAHVEITAHAEPIHVGSLYDGDATQVSRLCSAIARGGIPCEPSGEIARDLWAKLLYNGLLNPLGAICGVPYGALGESLEMRDLMQRVANEIFAVMHAAGYRTHWASAEDYLETFYADLLPPTARHESSTLQDLRAGKRTEIDALLGPVVRLGALHGVPAPVCHTLYRIVGFLERREGSRRGPSADS